MAESTLSETQKQYHARRDQAMTLDYGQESIDLAPIFQQVEICKKRPLEQNDFIYLYLTLENYIIGSNLGYKKETLRAAIRKKFNVLWMEPRLRALFTLDADNVLFLKLLLEAVLNHLRTGFGVKLVQELVENFTKKTPLAGLIVTDKGIDFRAPDREIFSEGINLRKAETTCSSLMTFLHNYTINSIGASATKKVFSEAFNEVNGKYGNISGFTEVVKTMPFGIFDEEKLSLLSREELEKISGKLTEIDVMKSEFTNIAAHELRTPIVPIKGFLSMMSDAPKKYGLNKKAREYIDICLRNVDRLNNLVQDILDISKLEANEMKFAMDYVNLAPILKNSVNELGLLCRQNGLLMKTEIPSKLPLVYGDAQRLSQVINNFLNNAIKFTEKGKITVRARNSRQKILVEITDTGMGINKEDIPKLFTKFFQTQDVPTRKTKGTGLGLAISKEIIEAHGGSVWASSKGVNRGSTFYFTLPVSRKK